MLIFGYMKKVYVFHRVRTHVGTRNRKNKEFFFWGGGIDFKLKQVKAQCQDSIKNHYFWSLRWL